MGNVREEATVQLGADLGTIERNLGIGKSYFDRWGKQLKSDQEKYTEWWGAELKKREEMEVASSVRAATRANLARKLRRERAEATSERITDEIGQGSIPEGWKKVAGAAKAAAEEGEHAFSHMGNHARHEIHGAAEIIKSEFGGKLGEISGILKGFAFGYVTVIAFAAIEGWKKFTEFIADQVYGNSNPINDLIAKQRDSNRDYYRKQNEARWAAVREGAKATAEARKQAKEQLEADEQLTDAEIRRRIETEGPDTQAGRASEKGRLQLNVSNKDMELERLKISGTRLEQTRAQVALEEAQLELLKFQTEEQRRQTDIQKIQANADRERQQIVQGEITKFMPTLDELASRGIFRSSARQIGRLDDRIKRDFEYGDLGAAKKDIAERDKLYDSIAGQGVLPEREEKKRMEDLARRTADAISDIRDGKKAILVKPEFR